MGKQAGPSPEELELIFNCFARGLSDREVLDEIQDTEFPVRNPRFMRERRREFNAARKVLEVTLEQQIDPTLAKAKEEHNAEIRALIEEWKDAIKTPKIDEMSLNLEGNLTLPFSTHEYQFHPLFKCLKEHLPRTNLWQNYSLWKNKIPDYFDSCKKLIKKITEDDRVQNWLEENPTREENIIVKPVLRCISDRAMGREPELLNELNPETGELEPYMQVTSIPGTEKFIERASRTQRTEQMAIGSVIYVDPTICTYYLDCQETPQIIELFNELTDLEVKIHESLDEILARRDYIGYTCILCPGQSKESS